MTTWNDCGRILICSLLVCSAVDAADTPAVAQRAPRASAELTRIVARLGDTSYAVRKSATRALIAAGGEAVTPLVEAAAGDNLEITTRAMRILQTIYGNADEATVDRIDDAVEQLRESPHKHAALRAQRVMEFNLITREQRAAREIARLGGEVKVSQGNGQVFPGGPMVSFKQVTIDKEWKGGDEALKYISRLSNVSTLYLCEGAPVSELAVKKLLQQNNRLSIQKRSNACLGVSGLPNNPGCIIRTVVPGSAADNAGLRTNDVINVISGEQIAGFEELVEALKKYDAGDTVEFRGFRNGRPMSWKVTLQRWIKPPPSE